MQRTHVELLRKKLRRALWSRDRGELDYYAAAIELAAAREERCCGACSQAPVPSGKTIEELTVRTWWAYDELVRLNREVLILEAELDQWRT